MIFMGSFLASVSLKVSPETAAAIAEIRDTASDAVDWLLCWYGDSKNELKVLKNGTGGIDALKVELTDNDVMYGIVKVKGGNEKDKLALPMLRCRGVGLPPRL